MGTIKRRHPIEAEIAFCVRGVISPLLANCYFRRFLLAWHDHGHRDQLDAHVVNYADDCAPRRREEEALM